MRVVRLAALLLFLGGSGVAGAAAVPGEVVVGYRHGPGAQVIRTDSVAGTLAGLSTRDDVRFAEPNYRYHVASVTPNDTQYALQWAPGVLDLPRAWDYATGNAAVKLAVVDTGIDLDHPDLADNVVAGAGFDFVDNDSVPDDPTPPPGDAGDTKYGHGTHVAGIADAVGNNGRGVAGVAWHASLLAERACDTDGVCTTANQAAAINRAVSEGARVVNLSIEGSPPSTAVTEAITKAPDVLFVAAAGNTAANVDTTPSYPCAVATANVICVAASNADDSLSSFSSFGPTSVDLAAPGGTAGTTAILAPYPGGPTYIQRQGTSMAAPQVAGTAALLWSLAPSASVATVRNAILGSVDKVPALAGKVATGGRLNAFRALAALDTTPPETMLAPVPAGPQRATSLSFTFTANEPNTTFECRLDGGTFAPCTSPHTESGLADGQHTFAVRAVDPHPNVDPSPAVATFSVDTTGPTARFDSQPPAVSYATAARFTFHFDEPVSDVGCSLDGGGFGPCDTRYETVVGEGDHTLQVRAADALGNVGTASAAWTVDDTAPGLTVLPPRVDGTSATVTFSASEPAGFRCALDDAPTADCTSPIVFDGLSGGPHRVTITATDTAGNVSAPSGAAWTIDAPLPSVTVAPVARSVKGPLGALADALAAAPSRRATLRYEARTGGTLEITVTAGARRLGSAHRRATRAGTVAVPLRLKRSARRAIARGRIRRLRLDAEFTPTGGGDPAGATRRIRL